MFTAVIVDDEKKARDFIELILKRNFSQIHVLAKAKSVKEGINAIKKFKPDIAFLDIELQDGTGFDILDNIPEKDFDFIFITAYNHYAIKAFKYSAVDYIIKPIDIVDFVSAINKIITNKRNKDLSASNYNILKSNLDSPTPLKIAIPVLDGIEFIETSQVISFNADGRYTRVFIKGGEKITISKSLGEFNDLIDNSTFFKPHKSHIINLKHVKKFVRKGSYLIMTDDSEVQLSRGNRDQFIALMINKT